MTLPNTSNPKVALTEVDIDAPTDRVWALLSRADGLATWLADEVEGNVAPGEELRGRDEDGTRWTGLVESVEPGCALALWWWRDGDLPSRVVLRVVGRPGGSRVVVTESTPGVGPLLARAAGDLRPGVLMAA